MALGGPGGGTLLTVEVGSEGAGVGISEAVREAAGVAVSEAAQEAAGAGGRSAVTRWTCPLDLRTLPRVGLKATVLGEATGPTPRAHGR